MRCQILLDAGKLYESVASSSTGATAASVASEAVKLCPINTAASVASDLVFNPGSSSTEAEKNAAYGRLRRMSGSNRRRTKTRGLHYRGEASARCRFGAEPLIPSSYMNRAEWGKMQACISPPPMGGGIKSKGLKVGKKIKSLKKRKKKIFLKI